MLGQLVRLTLVGIRHFQQAALESPGLFSDGFPGGPRKEGVSSFVGCFGEAKDFFGDSRRSEKWGFFLLSPKAEAVVSSAESWGEVSSGSWGVTSFRKAEPALSFISVRGSASSGGSSTFFQKWRD